MRVHDLWLRPCPFVCACLPCGHPAGLSDPVAKHWPAFGAAGKDAVTVSDLLKCRSGVEVALPAKFSTYTSFKREAFPALCDEIAAAAPVLLRTCGCGRGAWWVPGAGVGGTAPSFVVVERSPPSVCAGQVLMHAPVPCVSP